MSYKFKGTSLNSIHFKERVRMGNSQIMGSYKCHLIISYLITNSIPDLYVVCFIVVRVQFHSLKSFRLIFY